MKYTADTSFIIGLFVQEPRSAVAQEMLRICREKKEPIHIPGQVIVEMCYVLEIIYKLPRFNVADYVLAVLGSAAFIVERYPFYYKVVNTYMKYPKINLGDIIIALEAEKHDTPYILTFDKHFETLGLNVVKDVESIV